MSEYQYYEFQAIDQPLTAEAQEEMHHLSSRVDLTSNSASFVYNYGDFRGDPVEVLTKYFDAMLYITNWGTRQIMFRFPRRALPPNVQTQYPSLEWQTAGEYVVLDILSEDEEGEGDWGWVDGEDTLPGIAPLRNDILRGDLRALYLAWLVQVQFEYDILEPDEDLAGPPVPPNLKNLSPALRSFMDFFELDPDLVTAAAQSSPSMEPSDEALAAHLDQLPEHEKRDFLLRVLRREAHLDVALVMRLRELAGSEQQAPAETRCSARQLFATVPQVKEQRLAAERKQAEIARLKKLERVAQQESKMWARVPGLIERKNGSAYDEAVGLLSDLRDLAEHQSRGATFYEKMGEIKAQYPTLRGLHQRMREAKLIS